MHIVIIGNGVSGITAARFIRKLSDYRITVISEETDYFFSRTALMYVFMGHLRPQDTQPYAQDFWKKNRIDLVRAKVERIDTARSVLWLNTETQVKYDKLIIATGSVLNKFGWKGQDLEGVSGLYHWQDLERIEAFSKGLKRAVIVGGGLIGIELAEMLHSRHIPVTFLVRENSFWNLVLPPEESEMVNREILNNHIDLRLNTELSEIMEDGNGRVAAVVTSKGERIDCGFVGLTVGVRPNIDFLRNTEIATHRGILVDDFLQTNVPNIYAIGDCAELQLPQPDRNPIEAVWYTGKMMGETVAYTICGKKTLYRPRLWFNSAKFFDIEYQTYGKVRAASSDEEGQVFWQHSDGKKSIRLIFEKKTQQIIGFNLMGVRFRHEVCEKWLVEKKSIDFVLKHLAQAHFDPEFHKTYSKEVAAAAKL